MMCKKNIDKMPLTSPPSQGPGLQPRHVPRPGIAPSVPRPALSLLSHASQGHTPISSL